MVPIDQFHVRVMYLVGAVGVLFLLRKPVRYPEKPGSKGFVVLVFALSLWLGSEGLTYFVPELRPTLALYNVLLWAIVISAIGWFLIAVEFVTRELPSRRVLFGFAAVVVIHFAVLWTNFFEAHELMYQFTSTVDNAILVPDRGPFFWVHSVFVYSLFMLATVILVAEWVNASGLRRRQAGILVLTPVIGYTTNLMWLSGVVELSFDPTPIGTTAGVLLLSYALYRAEFLEIVPVGRQTVVEEMTDTVVILDDDNRVVDWNRAARELFDTEDVSVGMPAAQFFDGVPDDVRAVFEGTTETETEVAFDLDGRRRHFSVLISPVGVGDGERLGRVIVVRDITTLKRREQQLVDQNEYLDEFAGIVSHDLQGPLMEIRGSADMAVRTEETSHVEHVLDATDRMEQLVDDLLDLARSGQQIAETEPVSLAEVSRSAWQRVWSPQSDLVVEIDRTVHADADRLQQLLENLFRNAVEHGSTSPDSQSRQDREARSASGSRTSSDDAVEHGSTSSRAEPDDAVEHGTQADSRDSTSVPQPDGGAAVTVRVVDLPDGFAVEDDGPGVPPAERDQVFERGYTTAEDGTGLGLGIVEQIAGAHGWSIRLTDGTAGGARFEITGVETES